MNPFQKQLLLKGNRSMAELSNPKRDGIGEPLPPVRASVTEFERDMDNTCEHGRAGYCFDCVRKRHNQEMLDEKFDDADDDYASTPHPSAYYNNDDERD